MGLGPGVPSLGLVLRGAEPAAEQATTGELQAQSGPNPKLQQLQQWRHRPLHSRRVGALHLSGGVVPGGRGHQVPELEVARKTKAPLQMADMTEDVACWAVGPRTPPQL